MGHRTERVKRALYVGRVARRGGLLRVLRELGVWGNRPATREGAEAFRHALEELGTTYIKLGQLLSSRPDLLPDVYIEELGPLVDEVPPVPFPELEPVIRGAFGDVFASIDPNPIATASVAQIHPALLRTGQPVVVKVRRARVLERIDGVKVGLDHGLGPEQAAALAREFFRAYVHQVTVEGVYHADPHRGNVLLTPDGRLVLLDFGLLGRLDDDTRRSFALLLLAVAENRADDVADLILGLSLTTIGSDEPGFVHELRRKLPRYHWRPLAGIRAGEALADLQRISLRYGIRLPPSFALVGKTLAQADSIARTLDPQLDPVALLAEDALEVMFREAERRLEPNAFFSCLFTQLDSASRLPRRVTQVVERLETGTLKVGGVPTDLADIEHVLRSVANRVGAALIVVGLLVSSALLARIHDLRWLAAACFVAATVLGLYMVWKIIRTPGEL